jgi:hypothetical protein
MILANHAIQIALNVKKTSNVWLVRVKILNLLMKDAYARKDFGMKLD